MTTFADQLERLLSEFSAETNALKRFALGQQIDALLRNHAKEIAALVRDVERIASWGCERAEQYDGKCAGDIVRLAQSSLAALNKEKA